MKEKELIQEILAMKQEISELKRQRGNGLICKISGIKAQLHKRVLIPVSAMCFLVATTITFAAAIPNSFTSGDPISASQMNENFSYIIERLWEVTGANLHYSTGNVGIGTSSPTQKLEVIGTVDADAFTVNGTPVGSSTSTYWNESGGNLDYTVGSVSVGTAIPGSVLNVHGNIDSKYTTYGVRLNSQDGGGPRLQIGTAADTTFFIVLGAFGGINNLDSKGNDFHLYSTNSPTGLYFEESNGNVGIGMTTPAYKLDVAGDINTTGDIRKSGTAYTNPDYVFEPDYNLMSIDKLTSFLNDNKHLPGMPSTKIVKEKGVRLFEQNRLIHEKLEEAYLYIIDQNKKLKEHEKRIAKLEARLNVEY